MIFCVVACTHLFPGLHLQMGLLLSSSLLKLVRGRPLQVRIQRGHSSVMPRRPRLPRLLGRRPNRTSARRLHRRGRPRGRNNTSTLRRYVPLCFSLPTRDRVLYHAKCAIHGSRSLLDGFVLVICGQ